MLALFEYVSGIREHYAIVVMGNFISFSENGSGMIVSGVRDCR